MRVYIVCYNQCVQNVLYSKERLTLLICEAIMKWNVGASYQKPLFGYVLKLLHCDIRIFG